jgi:hypothetical protein
MGVYPLVVDFDVENVFASENWITVQTFSQDEVSHIVTIFTSLYLLNSIRWTNCWTICRILHPLKCSLLQKNKMFDWHKSYKLVNLIYWTYAKQIIICISNLPEFSFLKNKFCDVLASYKGWMCINTWSHHHWVIACFLTSPRSLPLSFVSL